MFSLTVFLYSTPCFSVSPFSYDKMGVFFTQLAFFKRHCAIIVESVGQGIAVESLKKKRKDL